MKEKSLMFENKQKKKNVLTLFLVIYYLTKSGFFKELRVSRCKVMFGSLKILEKIWKEK